MFYVIHLIATVLIVLCLIPVTIAMWVRLDTLGDDYQTARSGRRPAILRTAGATMGWWFAYTTLATVMLGQYVIAVLPAAVAVLLIGSSAVARRRREAPWWARPLERV